MSTLPRELGLEFNPFEPSASGEPLSGPLFLPEVWKTRLSEMLDRASRGKGVKPLAIAGEYGSGKSFILKWLQRIELPTRRIRAFYFDNPGVQFYDLANSLLRQIGRKDFAKHLWELSVSHVGNYQKGLFSEGFEEYLRTYNSPRWKPKILSELQNAIVKAGVTEDEEIAHRFARVVAEMPTRPYFEYRDFIAGGKSTLVAEGEEAKYFNAILSTLRISGGINAVAFLIDEFEEVSIQKRLSRREAHDYLATLKRLLNLAKTEELWVVLAMTRDGVDKTKALEPALWERFTADGKYMFEIPALGRQDAYGIIRARLANARFKDFQTPNEVFPFPEDVPSILKPATISNSRRLIKVCFYAISEAKPKTVPFTQSYLQSVEEKAFPSA